ncbi:hexameric tyrosine-coordinated heme protein [Bradyrhizobium sp. NAS80.1]|uniref:hexameric tyrosine-coordinated heme protein n=1 Tax=Bradyrhizobium sp. NAS80.1 TaxID=1680159 RepID=UPI0024BFE46C|nr:hexameric tyrosine-coordinated heme protein [Bradyrhizobium sp. NAS80.1]
MNANTQNRAVLRNGARSSHSPSDHVRSHLRAAYEQDLAQLITASHVIAVHFQTVAAANSWWK